MKKHTVTYSNPNVNPFRTLPKDAPMRAAKDGQNGRSGSGYVDRTTSGGNFNNFRGRTPGYNAGRGNMNGMGGGFNRNFSGPGMANRGGYQAPVSGFQGNTMGGNFGVFSQGMMNGMRGGTGNMRGGRGGMGSNLGNGMIGMPMGGMPMGNMGGMGNMAGPMGMGNMGGGMPGMITRIQISFTLLASSSCNPSRRTMLGSCLARSCRWTLGPYGYVKSGLQICSCC